MNQTHYKRNRNCRSVDCTHRKYKFQRTSAVKQTQKDDLIQQTSHRNENQLPKNQQNILDPFQQQLKYLIQSNSQYFQNKIAVTDKIRPNQYTFKIPTKTPITIYKKHYTKKQASKNDLKANTVFINSNTLNATLGCVKPQNKFDAQTIYQNQFINMHNSDLHKSALSLKDQKEKMENQRKTDNNWIQQDAPTFMETQNKCFFLNWGGKNAITSMKPSHKSAVVNVPLDGRTVYKNDFQGRTVVPNKIIVPQSSITKSPNGFTLYQTSYGSSFNNNKQNLASTETSCKPKNFQMKKGVPFKNITEYRSEYVKVNTLNQSPSQDKNLEQLTELIMNL